MIQLLKIDLGLTTVIIKDCLTDTRANEFLKIHEEENSHVNTIQFKLDKTNTTNLTTEELEKRQRERKHKRAC